jgi:hypothetical protein
LIKQTEKDQLLLILGVFKRNISHQETNIDLSGVEDSHRMRSYDKGLLRFHQSPAPQKETIKQTTLPKCSIIID